MPSSGAHLAGASNPCAGPHTEVPWLQRRSGLRACTLGAYSGVPCPPPPAGTAWWRGRRRCWAGMTPPSSAWSGCPAGGCWPAPGGTPACGSGTRAGLEAAWRRLRCPARPTRWPRRTAGWWWPRRGGTWTSTTSAGGEGLAVEEAVGGRASRPRLSARRPPSPPTAACAAQHRGRQAGAAAREQPQVPDTLRALLPRRRRLRAVQRGGPRGHGVLRPGRGNAGTAAGAAVPVWHRSTRLWRLRQPSGRRQPSKRPLE